MSLGILCPGQGAQTAQMLDAVRAFAEARPVLQALEEVLGLSIAGIEGLPPSDLHDNRIAQPLIMAYELALWSIVAPRLPEPRAVAGYSVGELGAHGCAGTFEPDATVRLAAARARLMDASYKVPSAMMAVRGLTRDAIEPLAKGAGAAVAIINGADRFVLGGPRDAIDALAGAVTAKGAAITCLKVRVPSHTPLLADATAAFAELLSAEPMAAPRYPVLSGLTGEPVTTAEQARSVLSRQISHTIDWSACLNGFAEQGCDVLLELGCGSDLSRMASDALPGVRARSVADFRSIDAALRWVEKETAA